MQTLLMLVIFAVLLYYLRSRGVDWVWSLLITAGVVLIGYPLLYELICGIIQTLISPPVPYFLIGAVVVLGGYVLWRRRREDDSSSPFR